MTVTTSNLIKVQEVLAESLGLADHGRALGPDTRLFGAMPELDSLAVLDLLAGLEERFGIVIEDHEFDGDIFSTVGTLVAFVDRKLDDAAS